MSNYIRIPLKILLSPLNLLISITVILSKLLLEFLWGITGLISMFFVIVFIGTFFLEPLKTATLQSAIMAYLFSPIGIPLIPTILLAILELIRDKIQSI